MQRQANRDHHKELFWRRLIRQRSHSRLTIRDFCAQHGVSEPSFYAWRRIIGRRDQLSRSRRGGNGGGRTGAPPTFVPVQVVPAVPTSASTLELVLGRGRVVRVPPGFDAATLRQLLAVLEGPSC